MKIKYNVNRIIPFFLVKTFLLLKYANGRIKAEKKTTHNISLNIILESIFSIGITVDVIPITTRRLKMLDPIRFPIERSFCFFIDAITDAANSGILVPIATIVTLITLSDISYLFATDIADFIKVSEPSHSSNPLNKT